MYGVLSFVKKLDRIATRFARTLNLIPYEDFKNLKNGKLLREEYNKKLEEIRNEFISYYLPVLDKLSKSKDRLAKERKGLFYFNSLLIATAIYLGSKYIMPINLILFILSGVGAGVNLYLNYKLINLIYTKDEILESCKLMIDVMNKSDIIIDACVEEMEERSSSKKVSNVEQNNYQYNPEQERYSIDISNNQTNSKVRKRIKRDGDK